MRYFFVAMLFYNNFIFPQNTDQGVKLYHYIFNEFSPGTVKVKSGETYNQVLTYNILTGEMILNKEGK